MAEKFPAEIRCDNQNLFVQYCRQKSADYFNGVFLKNCFISPANVFLQPQVVLSK
jgi:hypothetical protein